MRQPVDVQFTYEDLMSVAELSNETGAFMLKIIKEASNPQSVTNLFGFPMVYAGWVGLACLVLGPLVFWYGIQHPEEGYE